jgi:hypothetical protein
MVEADSHLKRLPTSILDMYIAFNHIDMLSMAIQYYPYSFIPTLLLGSDFGVRGHLWCQHDVIMPWLRLTVTSNCFPHHIYIRHIQSFEHIDKLSIGIWVQPYTVIPTLLGLDFGVLGHLWS